MPKTMSENTTPKKSVTLAEMLQDKRWLNGDMLLKIPPFFARITKVSLEKDTREKEIWSASLETKSGKPMGKMLALECASVRKVLLQMSGSAILDDWVGLEIIIYRDPTAKWAGKPVGGVRIKPATGAGEASK